MFKKRTAPRLAGHALMLHETVTAYLFMLPALIFFCSFVLAPMVIGLYTSFFNYTMKNPVSVETFIGLKNYVDLFHDPKFIRAMLNTFILVIVTVPAVTLFSLWVGSSIYEMKGGIRSTFRCIFYLPVVTGTVAVVVVWRWIFDGYFGVLNYLLEATNVIDKPIMWLGDKRYAIWCIIIIMFTTYVGQPIVLYVAALGNVDVSLVEAAKVDGATDMQVFWKIKWPQIMPTTLYIVVITTINTFQCFSLIQLLTSGGPQNSTNTVMYYLYQNAFSLYKYGYANSMGVILAIVIAILSAIQFKVMSKDVNY
ncbi:MAG: sugar ABC transporter permease [Oscillospiraceae bacterium]|nr:sugar ABC transporter permease [Oscillospiraceae bacterium]